MNNATDKQNNSHSLRNWFVNYNISKGGALLILLIVTILPFIILSFYSHPCWDDFFFINLMRERGFWGAQKWWYLTISGRYFASIMFYFNPLIINIYWAYKLNALVLITLLVIATYWLSSKLFRGLNKMGKIGVASLFIFAFIRHMPIISEEFYWLTASDECVPSQILTLLLLGSILSYYHAVNKKWYLILSCLLAIAAIGCYEITMLFIDFIALLFLLFNLLKKRALLFPLTLFVVCIIFSLISVTAPGNSARGTWYPESHKLLFSIHSSIFCSIDLLRQWLPFIFFMALLLFDLLSKSIIWDEETDFIFIIPPWFTLLACLSVPVISLFTHFWAEGQYPPLRLLDIAYFYFLVGMLYLSLSVIYRIKKRYPDFSLPVYAKFPVYILLIVLLFFRTNNITVAYNDILSGTASAYNKERMERHDFLTSFKGDSCLVDSIKDRPKSIFFFELPRDSNEIGNPGNWVNKAFCQYYHKKYIGVRDRSR